MSEEAFDCPEHDEGSKDCTSYLKKCYPNLPFPDDGILVAVNNKLSSMERILKNKDNVTFLPFLGGG